ncbi:hypothetical protein pEaSNUABM54_00238 [Erwinia phage pEa_SNUABM_54]|nr:hypothetical protein pEaSNUABM54_00238 [Erwinia phage pEa_SNUABM_54]
MLTLASYHGTTLGHVTGDIFSVGHPDGTKSAVSISGTGVRVISGKELGKDLESWVRFTILDVSTPLHQLDGRSIPEYHDDSVDNFNVHPTIKVEHLANNYLHRFGLH